MKPLAGSWLEKVFAANAREIKKWPKWMWSSEHRELAEACREAKKARQEKSDPLPSSGMLSGSGFVDSYDQEQINVYLQNSGFPKSGPSS